MADPNKGGRYGPNVKIKGPIPLGNLMSKEQREAVLEAIKAGKKGYTYDHKTGQYGFKFRKGGAVCRGQGRVSRPRKFRIT